MMNLLPAFPTPWLRACIGRLPVRPPSIACCALMNQLVLPVLDEDTRALMQGRSYVMEVTDIGLVVGFTLGSTRFEARSPEARPDLRIASSGIDFARMAAREIDADTLFFSRRLVMQGDTELGLIVRNAIDAVDFDETASGRIAQAALRRGLRFAAIIEKQRESR